MHAASPNAKYLELLLFLPTAAGGRNKSELQIVYLPADKARKNF